MSLAIYESLEIADQIHVATSQFHQHIVHHCNFHHLQVRFANVEDDQTHFGLTAFT